MNNSDQHNISLGNKRALIFDTGQVVLAHGNVTVELSEAEQVGEVDMNDVPDDQFLDMMKTPDESAIKILEEKMK